MKGFFLELLNIGKKAVMSTLEKTINLLRELPESR